jgi:hypothetical protein
MPLQPMNGQAIQLPSQQQRIAAAQQQVNQLVISTAQLIYSQLAAAHIGNLEPGEDVSSAELRRFAELSKKSALYMPETFGMIQVQDAPPPAEEAPAAATDQPAEPSPIVIP